MAEAADNKTYFPSIHYAGFVNRESERGTDTYILGFLTEDGDDAAAKKRRTTVDDWVRQYSSPIPSRTYENKPLTGFRLSRSVSHGGRFGGQSKFRIEDPRGFELEITADNLSELMDNCTIQQGEILEECRWARRNTSNVLVVVGSPEYEDAERNTERRGKKVSAKEVEIGNTVLLANGTKGVYFGKYNEYEMGSWYSGNNHHYGCRVKSSRVAVLLVDDGDTFRIETVGTLKVAEILDDAKMTVAEAEAKLHDLSRNKNATYRSWNDSLIPQFIPFFLAKGVSKVGAVKRERITKDDLHSYRRFVITGNIGGERVAFSCGVGGLKDELMVYCLDQEAFDQGKIVIRSRVQAGNQYWNRHHMMTVVETKKVQVSSVDWDNVAARDLEVWYHQPDTGTGNDIRVPTDHIASLGRITYL